MARPNMWKLNPMDFTKMTPARQAKIEAAPAKPEAPIFPDRRTKSAEGVVVEGLDGCLVKFAKCCTPVPGDKIRGFITRGAGVSVHRFDCPNASDERIRPEDKGRWLDVSWGGTPRETYPTTLEVLGKDRNNLVLDVSAALSSTKVRVAALSARTMPDDTFVLHVDIDVKDIYQLNLVIRKIEQISGVTSVTRPAG